MPKTFALPVKVEQCPCGQRGCSDYHLSVGKFVQGSGFTLDQAIEIAGVLNSAEKFNAGGAPTKYSETEVHNFGQRLLALTPGGSEYFLPDGKGGGYKLDLEAIVSFLERHHHYRLELMKRTAPHG